jgi:Flp pilus assembly protein TadD
MCSLAFDRGIERSRQGDYRGAIDSFDRALELDPDLADAYGHRCVARHQTGDTVGAIADCHRAAALYLQQGDLKQHQYARKMLDKLQAISTSKL